MEFVARTKEPPEITNASGSHKSLRRYTLRLSVCSFNPKEGALRWTLPKIDGENDNARCGVRE